jgi:hypothetical protein
MWNIHDLTPFNSRPPKFTRSWLQKLKKKRREGRKKTVGFTLTGKGTTNEEGSVSPTRSPSPDRKSDEEEKGFGSSSEDETTGVTIKNAS